MTRWLLVLGILLMPSGAWAQFFVTPPNMTCANDPRILAGSITLPKVSGRLYCGEAATNTVRVWTGFEWRQPLPDSCTFATLGTVIPTNSMQCYCTDCVITSPCVGAGTGAMAKRINAIAVCN